MATYRISTTINQNGTWVVNIKERGSGSGLHGYFDNLDVYVNDSHVYSGRSGDFDFRYTSEQVLPIASGSYSPRYGVNSISAVAGEEAVYAPYMERWSDSASWEKKFTHTLYYDANGGSGAPSSQSISNFSTTSFDVTLSGTVPTLSGSIFQGWADSSSATEAQYQPSTSYSMQGGSSKTIYAVWKIASNVFFNGTKMEEVYFNGTKMEEVYFNGIKYL